MNQCGGQFRVRRRTATLGGTVLGEAMLKTQEIAPIRRAVKNKHVCSLGACARPRATKRWFARHGERRHSCRPWVSMSTRVVAWVSGHLWAETRARLVYHCVSETQHVEGRSRHLRILVTSKIFSRRSGGHSGTNFILRCGGLQVFILAKGVAFAAKTRVVNVGFDWAKEHNHKLWSIYPVLPVAIHQKEGLPM